MKRYSNYEFISARWYNQIPIHWHLIRIKDLISQSNAGAWGDDPETDNGTICLRVADMDFNLGVFKNKPVSVLTKRLYTEEQIEKLTLEQGDILIEKSGGGEKSPVGRSVYFDKSYPALFANFMQRIRFKHKLIDAHFASYLLRTMYYRGATWYYVKQTTGIQNLDLNSMLAQERFPVPPREEQEQIVRYLDWQVSKINRLIAAKRKEIERIQEHLDKSIEIMFDEIASSSNDSIPLGRHITSIESGTSVNSIMGTADNDSIGVLSTSCVYGNNFDLSQNKRVAPSDYGRVSCPVKKNTLIISRMNAPSLVGACGFSEKDDTRVYLPDRLWQVHFDNVLMPEYAWRYLSTKRIKSWFATIATGTSSSMKNITKPQLKSIQIPFPSLEKQAETVRRIKTLCDKCNAACHVFEESIMHLIDLRTRLISDVVTGQVDVRGIKVPDDEYINNEITEEEFEEESENNEEE